ncbi:MAG: PAS domain S-box protein, partial [Chloroflexi bacterium]|nr:PAS domain S-box protein [Chloroflexota bacterium]
SGTCTHLVGSVHDITERKKAEEQLRAAEQNFRNSIDDSPLGIRIINAERDTIYANRAMLDIYGYDSLEELNATPIEKRYTPESYAELEVRDEKRRREESVPPNYEVSIVCKDGRIRQLEIFRKEVLWNGKRQFQMLHRDVTEHKQAEEKILQAAREWQTTFDSISDWVSIHDKDYKIIRVNKAFADFVKLKPEEIIGRRCYELIHGEKEAGNYCSHQEALDTGKSAYKEFYNPHLGIYMEVVCSPIFNEKGEITTTIHIGRDITERKRMETQMMVTDRLASIGELASGVAHELNNPLTGIIGFSELLLDKKVPADIREDLMVINREAKRTAQVVRNLLTFARKHPEEKQAVNINSTISIVLGLRAYEQKVNNIQVITRFAADLPELTADSFQLQQVFLNIIINAEYFMIEAHHGGTLTITTERIDNFVRVSIADDGPGIAQENLEHIFDPFFTTKEVGKGTGLGLSICHGTVTAHGGRIYAESELGKGATFIVELPISNDKTGVTE